MLANKALSSAPSAEPVFVESVFSTYLYTGTGATQTITNGIDLSGKGGLVWIKGRSGATGHRLTDTARGATKSLTSNATDAEATESTGLTAFGSTGFTIGADADYNTSSSTYVSWAFREQAKFFDVVTYTGDGSASPRQIAHSLGSVPGFIVIKRTDTTSDWTVWHRSVTGNAFLQTADAWQTGYTRITTPDSTTFTVGASAAVNASGGTYVAYLFAHNAGGFGLTGTDNVISCGSFTTDGSGNATVTLGYEPQWILVKQSNAAGSNWILSDVMRGIDATGTNNPALFPNTFAAESGYGPPNITSTGFKWFYGGASNTYIYIAIRRGPMRVPTVGTSVFSPNASNAPGSGSQITTNFPVDLSIVTGRIINFERFVTDRLRGVNTPGVTASQPYLFTQSTDVEGSSSTITSGWDNTKILVSTYWGSVNAIFWNFRRAPGFFDVVAYTGTGVAGTVSHNLAAVPEIIIVKRRSNTGSWETYVSALGNTGLIRLQTTDGNLGPTTNWNNTNPTASVFSVGTGVNASASTYIAYLFASCPGVSKVGSYTGTGTTLQVNCGFTGGARFVLIKRTDSTGDWYVWDSARGIVAGNDPYLLLNSTAAEVTSTDYIDTYSAGFEISSTAPAAINANGGTFIFLAIA